MSDALMELRANQVPKTTRAQRANQML